MPSTPAAEKSANSVLDSDASGIAHFRERLSGWFAENKRPLPWRFTSHWYPVFLSEFLLQQTQVDQALPYYEKFIKAYPDIHALAAAHEQDVLTLWAGLGYYARARNLLKAAIRIRDDFKGHFPESYKEAISLPGIGDYTASAILSMAFNLKYPVIDGNVQRVITRLFAIPDDIRSAKTNQKIREICTGLIDPEHPGSFNEGLMELGAMICTPKNPLCGECPVQDRCRAFALGQADRLPYKSPPAPKKLWYHYVLVMHKKKEYLIVQRKASGLLASLWEFPVLEVTELNSEPDVIAERVRQQYNLSGQVDKIGPRLTHVYSHIRLQYQPVFMKTEAKFGPLIEEYAAYKWVKIENLADYPIHNAHQKIIGELLKN